MLFPVPQAAPPTQHSVNAAGPDEEQKLLAQQQPWATSHFGSGRNHSTAERDRAQGSPHTRSCSTASSSPCPHFPITPAFRQGGAVINAICNCSSHCRRLSGTLFRWAQDANRPLCWSLIYWAGLYLFMLQDLVLSLARHLESPKEDGVAEAEKQHPYNTGRHKGSVIKIQTAAQVLVHGFLYCTSTSST